MSYQCQANKKGYDTEDEAINASRLILRKFDYKSPLGMSLNVYFCHDCRMFHFGHTKNRKIPRKMREKIYGTSKVAKGSEDRNT